MLCAAYFIRFLTTFYISLMCINTTIIAFTQSVNFPHFLTHSVTFYSIINTHSHPHNSFTHSLIHSLINTHSHLHNSFTHSLTHSYSLTCSSSIRSTKDDRYGHASTSHIKLFGRRIHNLIHRLCVNY